MDKKDNLFSEKMIDNGYIVHIAQINEFVLIEMSKIKDKCEYLSTFCGRKTCGKIELFTKLSTLSTIFTYFLHKKIVVNKKICFVKKDKNIKNRKIS